MTLHENIAAHEILSALLTSGHPGYSLLDTTTYEEEKREDVIEKCKHEDSKVIIMIYRTPSTTLHDWFSHARHHEDIALYNPRLSSGLHVSTGKLDTLDKFLFSPLVRNPGDVQSLECVICTDEVGNGNTECCPRCPVLFHTECFEDFVKSKHGAEVKCPVCQYALIYSSCIHNQSFSDEESDEDSDEESDEDYFSYSSEEYGYYIPG